MTKKSVFLLVVLFIVRAAGAQTYSPEIEKKIKEVETHLGTPVQAKDHPWMNLRDRMAYYHIPGLSIAVVHNYKIEWARGYGWADSAEKRPVTVHTLFQAASISKSLNGVGLVRLGQEKQIDLYTDINQYLRSWKFPYDSLSNGKKISVANLLSHTGGLTVHGFPGYATGVALPTVVQVLNGTPPANTAAVRSMYAPGIKSEYSGGGTTISQLIVMDVTGEKYDRWMAAHVLQPMGMTESFYTQPAPADEARVLATAYHADGSPVPGKYHVYPEEAPAGLWTNPADLCKYIIETQLSYAGKSAKVLDAEHTRLRLTPYVDSSAALGVFITKAGGARYFQHGGANEGFRCQYYGSMEGGDGVVVMVNSDNGGILNEVVTAVATAYGWKDFYHPVVKTVTPVKPEVMTACAGRYRDRKRGVELTIAVEGDHLLATLAWDQGREFRFYPESATKWFSTDAGVVLTMEKGEDGRVKTFETGDGDLFDRTVFAQTFTADVQRYIDYPGGTIAITDVTVFDGTGAAPRAHQTIVMKGGIITEVGAASVVKMPEGATVIAGSGKTVIPGLVMLHEHLYYTIPIDNFFNVAEMPGTFPRMYLAGGVTTSRTGGSIEPQTDLALRRMIGEGKMMGPDMDITAPYIERAGFDIPSINIIRDSAQAAREVAHWADKGCTSIKMYMHITRGDLAATVREAHQRGMKVTGHLCTVTYREAAEIGIDDLEHGFMAASDFDEGRIADSFDFPKAHQALQQLPVNSPKMAELIGVLIKKKVAVTSTLPVFEPYTAREIILGGGIDAMLPEALAQVKTRWDRQQGRDSLGVELFRKELAWEKQFFDGGGLLVAGTDPTGAGRTIAGYSDWRQIELLVEGGFTIPQAIQVCTLNGARYLGREREIGTISAGKRADLVLIDGDLGADVKNIRKTAVVFKGGVGFDSPKIFASVKGRVGLN